MTGAAPAAHMRSHPVLDFELPLRQFLLEGEVAVGLLVEWADCVLHELLKSLHVFVLP